MLTSLGWDENLSQHKIMEENRRQGIFKHLLVYTIISGGIDWMRDSSTNLHSIHFLDTKISRDKGV
jgi:hypothetical protein